MDLSLLFYSQEAERPEDTRKESFLLLNKTLVFHFSPTHHSLWGNLLWNGSKKIAALVEKNTIDVRGRSVLELGAGVCLGSVACVLCGAKNVVSTDYPSDCLAKNMERNIRGNVSGEAERSRIAWCGYRWGDSVDGLLGHNGSEKFDVVLMGDLVFNHSEHRRLAWTVKAVLKEDGIAVSSFSHYRPKLKERDRQFLSCLEKEGLSSLLVDESAGSESPNEDCAGKEVWTYSHCVSK
ncbi:MAG: nicotinamide N-methyltransferase [Amphiamblys sp. WSBS2006]|nr:MAG: nicotinamide N-methyltransferase [Amphiamblys sp. WSBS2006]